MKKTYLLVGVVAVCASVFMGCTSSSKAPTAQSPKTSSASCGIENCHGLDISCGKNVAQMCTEMYQVGDKCRQYAKCGVVNGTCQLEQNPKFTVCKTCVEGCMTNYGKNPEKLSACEAVCQ